MQRSVIVGVFFAALAVASAAQAGNVCAYSVRYTLGQFCPVHGGATVCLSQTAAIGPCDQPLTCYGGIGTSCEAKLEPVSGPQPQCPLGSVRPRPLVCFRRLIIPGRVHTPTPTGIPQPPTATPTVTPIPPATATQIPSPTATLVPTPPATATAPATQTAIATNTATGVPTGTATSTITATSTATAVPSATNTNVPGATSTSTAVSSATNTVGANTATVTPVATGTNTAGATNTSTPLSTATNTAVATNTATAPAAATNTNTAVATNTATPPSTATRTAVATNTATAPPAATNTNTAVATNTATPISTATRTNTPAATSTATPPSTNTPVPTNTVQAIGKSVCTLTTGSELFLQTQALPLTLTPTGSFSIDCGAAGAGGTAACACELMQFGAVVIPAIGDVCVNPATGCQPGTVDCDGGAPLDVSLDADHNIGSCTSDAACATACDAHCSGLGAGFARQSYGCEGHCQGGSNAGGACTLDSQCPGGQCPGGEPVGHADTCNCVCAGDHLGDPSRAGGLFCNLGTQINVELPSTGACGDQNATIQLAPVCGGISTETSTGVIRHANNSATTTIPAAGAESVDGTNLTCSALTTHTITGLKLVGQLGFFDSTLGDIRTRNTFVCQ